MPKIMIVDDDVTIQLELEEYLTHMDYTVVGIADTGAGAVEMASEMKPDLILMDVNLAGEMDGISATQEIKEEMDVEVVFITGFDESEFIERTKLLEPFDYVMKPFDEQEIKRVIGIVLHKRKMELELNAAHHGLEQSNLVLQGEIEARKKAEEALRESEEVFRELIEQSPVVFEMYDKDGIQWMVNSAYGKLWGIDPKTTVGTFDIWKTDQIEMLRPYLVRAYSGESVVLPDIYWDPQREIGEGRDRWISTIMYPLMDTHGQVQSIVILHEDVTDRKQVEDTLRESTHDLEERIKELNCLYGISEIVEKPDISHEELIQGIVNLMPPAWQYPELTCARIILEDREFKTDNFKETIWKQTSDIISNGKKIGVVEAFYLEEQPESGNGPFLREETKLTNAISERLGKIIERIRSNEKEQRIQAQLQRAEKMEAIGTLASGIAHDFNNILFSIIGFTEMTMENVEKGSLVESNLRQVHKAGNRARDLVKQILTFSREDEQEQKPFQVKYVVEEVVKFLRASLPSTIEIAYNIQSDSLLMGDSTQIHRILMNLCTNASHAMEEKGGVLDVALTDTELDSGFTATHPGLKPGPFLRLTVTDTGYGIKPHVLERIFEPFFTTKQPGEGTGLGLSVVHGIVKSHGGGIYAYSEPGKGSTFHVYLPAIKRESEEKSETARPFTGGTERILFVDDEPMLADLGEQLLKSLGYEVATRTSSRDALELFRKQPDQFDLIITDMTMPHMTGDTLAREMIKIRTDIPVILCSGYSKQVSEENAKGIGIRAFVMKPILRRTIAETVRKVLDTGGSLLY